MKVAPTLLDRAIAHVAPGVALRRAVDRARFATASASLSGYDAARRERSGLRNFNAQARTADDDTLPNLDVQRARSRDMARNAPLAAGAINTVVTNVVGTGLTVSAQANRARLAALANITPDQVAEFEAAAEGEWSLFTRAEHCDAMGQTDFAGMQELAFRAVLESGDAFAPFVARPAGSIFDFAVQLIEADRVSNPSRKADSQSLAAGVEFDAAGRPIAYHVADIPRLMGAASNWRRLAAEAPDGSRRVLHLLHRRRIDQTRGVPYLAPVMSMLKSLDRYSDAEIAAAVLNACFALVGASADGTSPLKAEAQAAGATTSGTGAGRMDIEFEPGMVMEGFMPGDDLKSFSPDRPSQSFDPFVQAMLRQVGVALELPFEVLVKHFTASYSAARAALLQAWAFFRMRRAWLATGFCQPTYEMVVHNAVLRGRVPAPRFLEDPRIRAAWLRTRWTGPAPGQLDPKKEVEAAEKRIALKLSTRTRETAELSGDDWEDTATELAWEEDVLERLGLDPEPVAAAPGAPAQPAPAPEEDPAEGGRDQEEADAA